MGLKIGKSTVQLSRGCIMEIKIPEVGESVREALLAKWFKKSGDVVKRDEQLC